MAGNGPANFKGLGEAKPTPKNSFRTSPIKHGGSSPGAKSKSFDTKGTFKGQTAK